MTAFDTACTICDNLNREVKEHDNDPITTGFKERNRIMILAPSIIYNLLVFCQERFSLERPFHL